LQYNQLQYIPPTMKQPPLLIICDISDNPLSCDLPDWVKSKCFYSCEKGLITK